jgi:hypothetical protein
VRSVVKLPADVASLTPAMASILMHPAIDESRWLAYIHQLAHLSQQAPSGKVNVGQRQGRERPRGVLLKPAVAHLGESPQALDHRKDMLDPGTHPRFVAVLGPLNFVHLACTAGALVGEVLGLGALLAISAFWLA